MKRDTWSLSPVKVTISYVVFCFIWHSISGVFFKHFFDRGFPWFVNTQRFVFLVTGTSVVVYALSRNLWKAKELFKAVFDHTTDGICVVDVQMKVLMVNHEFVNMLGYSQNELLGNSILSTIPSEEVPMIKEHFQRVVSGEVPFVQYEGERVSKHGSTLITQVKLSPIKNGGGDIVAVSALAKDVTELRQAQDLLVKTEKLSAVGELAAGVAHEIRNPLTSIKGFLQILGEVSADKRQIYLGIMTDELSRIESITTEMLALAKPQAVHYRPVSLAGTLAEVADLMVAEANMHNVAIVRELFVLNPTVTGEKNQLKQVFMNLTKNAIEAMPHGGTLRVRITEEQDMLLVRFIDNGQGIPVDVQYKVWDPFFTTKESGTGLGLLIIQNIVQQHRGSVDISSVVGIGTTVTIALPKA